MFDDYDPMSLHASLVSLNHYKAKKHPRAWSQTFNISSPELPHSLLKALYPPSGIPIRVTLESRSTSDMFYSYIKHTYTDDIYTQPGTF